MDSDLISQICSDFENIDYEFLISIADQMKISTFGKTNKEICDELTKKYVKEVEIVPPPSKNQLIQKLLQVHDEQQSKRNLTWLPLADKWKNCFGLEDLYYAETGAGGDCQFYSIATALSMSGAKTPKGKEITMPFIKMMAAEGIENSYTKEDLLNYDIDKDQKIQEALTLGVDGDDYTLSGIANRFDGGKVGFIVLRDRKQGPNDISFEKDLEDGITIIDPQGSEPEYYIMLYHTPVGHSGHYQLISLGDKKMTIIPRSTILPQYRQCQDIITTAARALKPAESRTSKKF